MDSSSEQVRSALGALRPEDLVHLLATEPKALMGSVLQLNRAAFYHNGLNAVVIASEVMELQGCPERILMDRRGMDRSVASKSRLVRKEDEHAMVRG